MERPPVVVSDNKAFPLSVGSIVVCNVEFCAPRTKANEGNRHIGDAYYAVNPNGKRLSFLIVGRWKPDKNVRGKIARAAFIAETDRGTLYCHYDLADAVTIVV